MNRRLVGVLVFALAVAGLTTFVVYRLLLTHLQGAAVNSAAASATTRLVVASHDLAPGALIKDSDMIEIDWPGSLPRQVVAARTDLLGRGVVAPIFEKEPILEQRLAPKGAGAGLASTIPIGMRALALPVNDVVSLAGFVVPGMHVDVLVAGDAPGESNTGRRCKTVLQNIEVLSVGQHFEKSLDGKPESAEVVNVLVTPDQAETLNLASSEAKVQLVLRNPMDTAERGTQGSSVAALFGQKPDPAPSKAVIPHLIAVAPVVAAPTSSSIEVFTGTHKTDQVVELRGGTR